MQFAMTSKIHDYVTHPEWIVDADAVIFMAQTIDNFVEQTRPMKPVSNDAACCIYAVADVTTWFCNDTCVFELVIRLVSMIMDDVSYDVARLTVDSWVSW